ncbi:prepilin peptidase [Rosenbergiella nectarea]|uniref:prepilin peptidase n=2 Tax=Rosenbergiella nectarea TaxID=988801 RepID=UPI001BDAB804|nr:A24 family peptidase [Rosenbergiella nectarea]MBT0731641.1 prepilin peptidase [Rosenbergiella nectarea subsp. apis]
MLFLSFFILSVAMIGGYLESLCLHYHPSASTPDWLRLGSLDFYNKLKSIVVTLLQRYRSNGFADFSLPIYPIRYFLYLLVNISGYLIFPIVELCLTYLLLNSLLYLLAVIDWEQGMLPNCIVLLLSISGILLAPHFLALHYFSLLLGAIVGFTSFYLCNYVYQCLYGKAGIGRGDMKLLAAIGTWTGWEDLALIVFFSSSSGIIFVLTRSNSSWSAMLKSSIPLGTFLCLTLWAMLTIKLFVVGNLFSFIIS